MGAEGHEREGPAGIEGAPLDADRRAEEQGLALLRAGAFFEAHECFEERWRLASGTDRIRFQGLAQLAASYEQLARGRARAAARTWAKARAKLAAAGWLAEPFDRAVAAHLAALGATPDGALAVDPERLPAPTAWPVPEPDPER